MATTDVSPVQTSNLLGSLHDFQKTFNENQRVKKLTKNWNRFLKAEATDTSEIFTVTIQDVAREAGVSVSTVSRAFTAPEMVREETRHYVLQTAERLGYRPNRAARGLITGRTGNLGVIVPDLSNPFFPTVISPRAARLGR